MQLMVNLGPRSYPILIAQHGFAEFAASAVPQASQYLVVADSHTSSWAEGIAQALPKATLVTIPAGEASKCAEQLHFLYDALADLPADRSTVVIAVGGGVIGDLAGFAAATYNRGLRLLMMPTSLLAMVDSSVGGKVGINHRAGKNLIGAFHQPSGVWINLNVLSTLPDREFRSGLAEVVKYGMILDPELFNFLEANTVHIFDRHESTLATIVHRSCQLKAQIVEQDEREETGLRAILNYGHTFAHAFETVGGYGRWLHGEAVAAGMVCASRLAEHLGRIPSEITQRQIQLLQQFGLPTRPEPDWPLEALVDVMRRDKKAAAGKLRFILPSRIGHVELVSDIPESLVVKVLEVSS